MQTPAVPDGMIVADNDSLLRSLLRSMLTSLGHSVFLAADGIEAVEYARRMLAQLVILDLAMPRLNGYCACEQIRQLPGYADVPIVILTAYDNGVTREAARRAGATAFFAKPFRPVDLLRGITPLIGGAGQRHAALEPVAQVWKRTEEPAPAYGEAPELSHGRHMLDIYRR